MDLPIDFESRSNSDFPNKYNNNENNENNEVSFDKM